MACSYAAGQRANDVFAVEISGNMAHRAVGVEFLAVKAGNAGSFLPAMLERMQAERGHRGRAFRVVNPEDSAFFAQFVIIKGIGGEHVQIESRAARIALPIGGHAAHVSPL